MIAVAFRLAFQQLTHRGAKLIGALLGVSVAIVLIFTQLGFKGALYDSATAAGRSLDADLFLTTREYQTMSFNPPWLPIHVLYDSRAVEGVASASPFYASTVQIVNPADGNFLTTWLFAYDPNQPVFLLEDVKRGNNLIRMPETALIDRNSRNELGHLALRVAQTGRMELVLPAASLTIQPAFRMRGTFVIGPTVTVDGNVITSDLNYYRFLGVPLDRISFGVVRVVAGANLVTVQHALEQRFAGRVRVFTKAEFVENEIGFYAHKTPIGFIFNAGLAVGVFVGVVFISQVLHGIVSDNMREYATLRAVGYKQNFFVVMVGVIAVVIALITYFPSILVTLVIYKIASSATHMPMEMKPAYLIEVFFLVVVMGLVAASMATKKLKQADPVDLF